MDKLTVSIVNFNSGNFLVNCLASIDAVSGEAKLDVYVADNASKDDSLEKAKKKFPQFNYIRNQRNLGFSKAHNIILKKLQTEFVLILNPDCKIVPETITYMLKFMNKNKDVGAASCKLEKEDGSIDWASHRSFPSPWISFQYYILKNDNLYHLKNKNMDKTHEVDSIVGAFFLTRKSVLEKVGLFDEQYFMYGEDLDLCFRIKKAGLKVMYVPEVRAIHYKGISSGLKKHSQQQSGADLETKKRAINAFYHAMLVFYKKFYQQKYPFFINWPVYLGINYKWWLAKRKLVV